MIRIVLIVALIALVASCAPDERDIDSFKLSIVPTGSGFACVLDGDAPDAWVVRAYSGEEEVDIGFYESSPVRVEFEHEAGLTRVECTAYYEEGTRSASLSLR